MFNQSLAHFALVALLVCLAAGFGAALSQRSANAAAPSIIWGQLLTREAPVSLQFADELPLSNSPWYAGRIVGYDGNMVAFINDGYQDVICIPLSSIRQIQLLPAQ